MRILGISPYHDASVCILDDGEITYFSKQERLTRKKRDELGENQLTVLNYVLDNYQDTPIDKIVICSPTPNSQGVDWLQMYMWTKIKNAKGCQIIKYCQDHHLAHATLAFNNSGFKEALTFVIDRNGAMMEDRIRESESVFICKYPANFKTIYKNYFLVNKGQDYDVENHQLVSKMKKIFKDAEVKGDSTMNITKVYESATTLIGQHVLENGKTMGLAGYGKDKKFPDLMNDDLYFHYHGMEVGYKEHFGLQNKNFDKRKSLYADYAFQVQKQTQEMVLNLVKKFVKKTGIRNVCLTGGYALNVVTNGYLIEKLPHLNFYFEPLADDSGNSLGAAMDIYRTLTKDKTIRKLVHTFFNHTKEKIKPVGKKCSVADIAKALSKQKTVAVYYGKAESGPRALGHRSILFDARNKNAKDIVNKIKKREWYRPFACSVLEEDANEYFIMYGLNESPFMTISFPVRKEKKNIIPGVIHVDNSCRIQTVNNSIPHFFELLTEFKYLTNVPVLLNTSFNLAGEALVESYEDAIKTFKKSDIDILWFPETERYINDKSNLAI